MPNDENYVSSELYRVMPPRKNPSQLREALDAVHDNPVPRSDIESDETVVLTGPERSWWARSRPVARWFVSVVVVGVIIAVIGGLIVYAITQR